MNQAPIAEDVRRFLREHVHTLEDFEILLFLCRRGERYWTASAIASELGLPRVSVDRGLEELASANVLDVRLMQEVAYRFQPATPEVASRVAAVLAAYAANRTEVTRLILLGRKAAIRDFSEAFRLKKDETDG